MNEETPRMWVSPGGTLLCDRHGRAARDAGVTAERSGLVEAPDWCAWCRADEIEGTAS